MNTIVLVIVVGILALMFVGVVGVLLIMRLTDKDDNPRSHQGPSSRSSSATTAAEQKKFNWLIGRSGSVEGKTFHVGKRLGTIGRGVGNFIQITDSSASKVHAQFKGAASGMQVKDMGSSNGTAVNGEPIGEASFTSLNDGDEIQIGETVFAYRQQGNFRDEALRGSRNVTAGEQKQTQAMGAVGGGDLQEQVHKAVREAGGDYEKAAQKLGLDADIVENIVEMAKMDG